MPISPQIFSITPNGQQADALADLRRRIAVLERGSSGGGSTTTTVDDATTTVKGKVQLAGDIGGTAAAVTVKKLVNLGTTAMTDPMALDQAHGELTYGNGLAGQRWDIRHGKGTGTGPVVTDGPTFRISATRNDTVGVTAGADANKYATFQVTTRGLTTTLAQPVAGLFQSYNDGTGDRSLYNTDALGIQTRGAIIGTGATGRGLGATLEGYVAAAAASTAKATGVEVVIRNDKVDHTPSASGSDSQGIWVYSSGTFRAGAGIQFGHVGGTPGWDTGIYVGGSTPGLQGNAITSATLRDDGNSVNSILINGTHSGGAIKIASGSGDLIAGDHLKIKGPRPWVDVTHPDYGADPTGTNDSCAAIQAAIDAINTAGGGTVRVPFGTYLFASALQMKSNVTLLGIDNPVFKYHASASSSASLITVPTPSIPGTDCSETGVYGQTNITVKGITFDGELRTSSVFLTIFNCTDKVTIEDCEFRNIYNGCLQLWGSNDISLKRLRFFSWGLAGYPSIGGAAVNIYGSTGTSNQTGTISSSGTTVTGSGTSFDASLIGKYIGPDGNRYRKVTAVASTTSLTIETAFITNLSATAWKLVDATPTTRVRLYDLYLKGGRWHPLFAFCRDFIYQHVVIKDCMESGIYGGGYGGGDEDNYPPHVITRDGVIDGFRITGVRRQNSAAAGMELAGQNIQISNFIINDTDGPGLQLQWPLDNYTVNGGQIWDTLVRRTITAASWSGGTATFTAADHGFQVGRTVTVTAVTPSGYNGTFAVSAATTNTFSVPIAADPGAYSSGGKAIYFAYPNYGQITILQRGVANYPDATNFQVENVRVANVIVGKWGLTPHAPYAIRLDGTSGEVMHNVNLNENDLRHGYTSTPFSVNPTTINLSATAVAGLDNIVHKLYSDDESVEFSARTLGLGKNAVFDCYANTGAGAPVRGFFRAFGAGVVQVGAVTDHVVQFIQNNATVLSLDSNGNTAVSATKNIIHPTKAGTPVDGDYTNPAAGMIAVDTTNGKLYFRTSSTTWKALDPAGGSGYTFSDTGTPASNAIDFTLTGSDVTAIIPTAATPNVTALGLASTAGGSSVANLGAYFSLPAGPRIDFSRAAATGIFFQTFLSPAATNTGPMFVLASDRIEFGPGGATSAARDIRWKRTAASEMSLEAGSTAFTGASTLVLPVAASIFKFTAGGTIAADATNGLKILAAGSDKLGFFGFTPKTRSAAMTTRNNNAPGALYTATTEAIIANLQTRVNELCDRLNENATTGHGLISGTA